MQLWVISELCKRRHVIRRLSAYNNNNRDKANAKHKYRRLGCGKLINYAVLLLLLRKFACKYWSSFYRMLQPEIKELRILHLLTHLKKIFPRKDLKQRRLQENVVREKKTKNWYNNIYYVLWSTYGLICPYKWQLRLGPSGELVDYEKQVQRPK